MTQIEQWLLDAGAKNLKPSGDNVIALCPFHSDRSRSFSMNTRTGQYFCFSEACGVRGGLQQFLEKACGYSRVRAEAAAKDYEVFSNYTDEWVELPDWDKRYLSSEAERKVAHERMLGAYDFCPAYMIERGFSKKTLREWEVGYDRETEYVTFPVRDVKGRFLGFSKRATHEGAQSKYLHLNFQKAHHIYGLHRAYAGDVLWVTEGQPDTIALFEMGLPKKEVPCSTMGANVSAQQIELLATHKRIILAFDLDDAGIHATRRVGDKLLELGKDVFIARNFPERSTPDGKKWDPASLMQFGTPLEKQQFISGKAPWSLERLDELF